MIAGGVLLERVGEELAEFRRTPVGGPVRHDAAEVEVQIVFERHPDAAVDLDAVVGQLGAVLADERRRGGGGVGRDRIVGRDGQRRGVGDRVRRFEPRLHVGEAMLERLVRRQRTTERVAIEGPLDGHVERRLHRTDRLGGGDRATDEQPPLDVVGRRPGLADERAQREAHVDELDAAVSA